MSLKKETKNKKEEKMTKQKGALIMHGWGKSKSHEPLAKLFRSLMEQGPMDTCFRFDFTGHGDSRATMEEASIMQFFADAEHAFDILVKRHRVNKEKVVLIGHSIGALIAVLLHLRLPRTGPLVLISPAIQQRELVKQWYSGEEIAQCEQQGWLDTPKGRIGWQYLKEAMGQDWLRRIPMVKVPTLVIHGSKDEDVPLRYAKDVVAKLGKRGELKVVQGAEHNFESFQAKQELIRLTTVWLKEHL